MFTQDEMVLLMRAADGVPVGDSRGIRTKGQLLVKLADLAEQLAPSTDDNGDDDANPYADWSPELRQVVQDARAQILAHAEATGLIGPGTDSDDLP